MISSAVFVPSVKHTAFSVPTFAVSLKNTEYLKGRINKTVSCNLRTDKVAKAYFSPPGPSKSVKPMDKLNVIPDFTVRVFLAESKYDASRNSRPV